MKKFLTSVADVYAYDESDNIVFTAKTLLDSSIEVSLGSNPVRGGRGNQLQYVYYHTGEMNFTLTDTQWNLAMLKATTGGTYNGSDNAYIEETITLSSGTGTVSYDPVAFGAETTIHGWVTKPDGTTVISDFTAKTFPVSGLSGNEKVCIRYYGNNGKSASVKISANMIPNVVRLVMEAQLNSADLNSNKIGYVQIIAPKVTLSGAFSISMTSDGVSNTPLTAMALAYSDAVNSEGCSAVPYYAKLIEVIDTVNWYDNVTALSIEGGDFTVGNSLDTTLKVWAIPAVGYGNAFLVGTSAGTAITFAVVAGGTASGLTCTTNTGVVSSGAVDGYAYVRAYITAKTSIDATIKVTVS